MFIKVCDRTGFQDHSEANQALDGFLSGFDPIKPAGLRIWRRRLEGPTFVPSLELQEPFRALFQGFYPPQGSATSGLADILAYYREASRRLGFDIDPPAFLLAAKSDDQSRAGRPAAAQEILEYALRLRPSNVDALLRMGNLTLDAGELDRAEECFQKAQKLHPDGGKSLIVPARQRFRLGVEPCA